MAYIALTVHGKIINIDKWAKAHAVRSSIRYLMTVENNKCHSVRKYNKEKDELVHCEDEVLVES